jgi:hypothetical protein
VTERKSRTRTRPTGAAAGQSEGPAAGSIGGGRTTRAARPAAKSAPAAGGASRAAGAATATVRFRPDWREDVTGDVRPGGRLRVEYATERLPGDGDAPAARAQGVVAEVRFEPGGQHHTGRVTGGTFEVAVPEDAREVMIWFYRTDGGATSWDSRFGENYRFPVAAGASGGRSGASASKRKAANRRSAPAA